MRPLRPVYIQVWRPRRIRHRRLTWCAFTVPGGVGFVGLPEFFSKQLYDPYPGPPGMHVAFLGLLPNRKGNTIIDGTKQDGTTEFEARTTRGTPVIVVTRFNGRTRVRTMRLFL